MLYNIINKNINMILSFYEIKILINNNRISTKNYKENEKLFVLI